MSHQLITTSRDKSQEIDVNERIRNQSNDQLNSSDQTRRGKRQNNITYIHAHNITYIHALYVSPLGGLS